MMNQPNSRSRTLGLVAITTLIGLVLGTLPGLGQVTQRSGQRNDALDQLIQERTPTSIVQPAGVALEATIDPARYFVGPSDVIAVNIWMSPSVNAMLTVTPEGTLIIPGVGEVKVSDMSLADAKVRILAEVHRKYSVAVTTVTLIRPRPIIVTVTGSIVVPGLYTLSSIDRATRAIEEANRIPQTQQTLQQVEELKQLIGLMSSRSIVIKHKDGTQGRVDITKFLATKEDRWNPYLREGDVVVVPRMDQVKNVFGIYGEVNAPGRYEYVEGDSVLDAVAIGQGFTRLAMKDSAEFSRLSLDGSVMSKRVVDLGEIAAGRQPNFPLQPGDRIVVKPKADLREDYRATVVGEVLYPGTYPLTKDRTRLSEIIRQAGGFTETAALKMAYIRRAPDPTNNLGAELLMSMRGNPNIEDTADILIETRLRLQRGIVTCDFEKLFAGKDSTQDIVLRSEDTIVVPTLRHTIYVLGQVASPGYIPYVQGQPVRYYVRKAGGYTDHSRPGDVKVIKNRTKQWLNPGETEVEDGDYIWVPKDPDRPFIYYATIASQVASVLSVIVGVALVAINVSK